MDCASSEGHVDALEDELLVAAFHLSRWSSPELSAIVKSVKCTVYSIWCKVYGIPCTVRSVLCTVYIVYSI